MRDSHLGLALRALKVAFGAPAQIAVGCLFMAITTFQTIWWLWVTPPTVKAVFIVSMEALYFAAYGVIGAALAVIWLNERTPDPE